MDREFAGFSVQDNEFPLPCLLTGYLDRLDRAWNHYQPACLNQTYSNPARLQKNPCGLQSPPRPACGLEIISTASCATSATVVKSGKDSSNQSPRSTVDPHFAGEGSPSSHWQSLNMRTNTDYPIMRWGHTSFTNKNTYCSSYHSRGIWTKKTQIIPTHWAFPMFNSVGFFLLPSPLVRYPLPGTGCLESPCSTAALCPNSTDSTTTSSASAVCSRLPTSLSITSSVSTCRAGAWYVCAPTAVKPSISIPWF